jgi:hypothetical protein
VVWLPGNPNKDPDLERLTKYLTLEEFRKKREPGTPETEVNPSSQIQGSEIPIDNAVLMNEYPEYLDRILEQELTSR